MATPIHRETDWGVPLPGDIVSDPERADANLKRLPLGTLDAVKLFGRSAPMMIDLGCGNGRATILSALARRQFDHLAVDVFSGAIRHAVRRANRRGLNNTRFAVADAGDIVRRLLTDRSIDEVHLYHPQPIYDLADAPKRLITPTFLVHVHRVLKPGGLFVIQTDHPAYWEYLQHVVPLFFEMKQHADPWPDAPLGRTRREILARQLGLPVFRATCMPHGELDQAAAQKKADNLPLPRFDADRKLRQVEEQEQQRPLEDQYLSGAFEAEQRNREIP
jgi:tRNA (guanine-N7-)-methyltransferase